MRKIVILLINIILLSVALFVYVYAHSGKTDSRGGHYDHQYGTYHYHHGYRAHSHANGGCPYYDDKTNHSTNNGNSNNSNSNSDGASTKQQKTIDERPVLKNIIEIGFNVLICSPLIIVIYYRIMLPIAEYMKRKFK